MALILVEQKQNTVGTADEAERPWTMAAANAPNPLGIHLGPTHLTAAEALCRKSFDSSSANQWWN